MALTASVDTDGPGVVARDRARRIFRVYEWTTHTFVRVVLSSQSLR